MCIKNIFHESSQFYLQYYITYIRGKNESIKVFLSSFPKPLNGQVSWIDRLLRCDGINTLRLPEIVWVNTNLSTAFKGVKGGEKARGEKL